MTVEEIKAELIGKVSSNIDLSKAKKADLEQLIKPHLDLVKANEEIASLKKSNAEFSDLNKGLQDAAKVQAKANEGGVTKPKIKLENGDVAVVNHGTTYQGRTLSAKQLSEDKDAIAWVLSKKGQKVITV